jgi:hypothetical protein
VFRPRKTPMKATTAIVMRTVRDGFSMSALLYSSR